MISFHNSLNPSSSEIQEMSLIFKKIDDNTIYQTPNYSIDSLNKRFFYIKNYENEISAYCIVRESSLNKLKFIKTAQIYFGVITNEIVQKNNLINYIIDYYKSKKYTEILFLYLNETFKYNIKEKKKYLDNLERGTLIINLNSGFEKIKNNFSKHLTRNIKKGIQLNLEIKPIEENDIHVAYDIYLEMSNKREINYLSKSEFYNLYQYSNKNGFNIGCFYNQKLIGGMFCIIQGNRIEYFIGFTDINYKHLPQSHLTFYKAIEMSTKLKVKYFDMGGAVKDINEDSQIHNINKFKFGFTKEFIGYQKSEKIELTKSTLLIKNIYLKLQKSLVK
jgi:lipid II:glycine glycyltransferase (peptidoglycan interpeptide bridge formation enzyme)